MEITMNTKVKSQSFPHPKLYKYCGELFEERINAISKDEVHPAILNAGSMRSMLFWYPDSMSELREFCDNDDRLKSHGWVPGFTNQPFVIWYKRNTEIQLLPFSLKSGTIIKTSSVSTEIPFAFRFIARYRKEKPVYVCHDPLVAALLNSHYLQAVACGGDVIPQDHIKELISLNRPLVYLNNKHGVDAAATFVKQCSVYPDSVQVALVDNILGLLVLPGKDIENFLLDNTEQGDDYLFKRIHEKRRHRRSLTVDEEIMLTYQGAHPETQKRWQMLISDKTSTREYANASRLLSELLYANMPLDKAIELVKARYDISISFND